MTRAGREQRNERAEGVEAAEATQARGAGSRRRRAAFARPVAAAVLALGLTAGLGLGVRSGAQAWAESRATTTTSTTTTAATTSKTTTASTTIASTTAAKSSPLKVVGLGDSVPSGGACANCTTYITQVAQQAASAQGRTAAVTNDAVSGATSDDVLDQLDDADVQAAVASSDLVIVTIGANDLDASLMSDASCSGSTSCWDDQLADTTSNITAILTKVEALQTSSSAKVVVTGYWNVVQDGQVGAANGTTYVANSDRVTRALNADIEAAAAKTGAVYVDEYTPFKGSAGTADDTALLAADGDHPDQAGHTRLASAIVSTLGTSLTTI